MSLTQSFSQAKGKRDFELGLLSLLTSYISMTVIHTLLYRFLMRLMVASISLLILIKT
jgi:hypothetical protein